MHADVFRPPVGFFGPMFLSVFVGSGVQIVMMASTVMVFAMLGFLSPANRGGKHAHTHISCSRARKLWALLVPP